jgi:hypothetical protein
MGVNFKLSLGTVCLTGVTASSADKSFKMFEVLYGTYPFSGGIIIRFLVGRLITCLVSIISSSGTDFSRLALNCSGYINLNYNVRSHQGALRATQ